MFGSRKDELLKNGNLESDYSVPSTSVLPSSDNFIDVNEMNLRKLDEKIDSVVEWIHQFYDRFRYLDEEVGTIRTSVNSNKESVGNLMQSSGGGNSIKVSADIEKLENDIKFLSQKVESGIVDVQNGLKSNDNVQLKNAQMNELSRMNEAVNANVDKSRRILGEVKNMFLEIRDIKDKLESVSSERATPEFKIRAALGSHDDIVKGRVKDDNKYKKLVEEKEKSPEVSHTVGSREWLREVKKSPSR